MKGKYIFNLALLWVLIEVLLMSKISLASDIKELSLNEIASLSDNIIHGKVINIKSYRNSDKTTILTDVEVEINSVYKGNLVKKENAIIQLLGGTIDDISTIVLGGPNFKKNEEVILFLKTPQIINLDNNKQKHHIIALSQGKYNVKIDKLNNSKIVYRSSFEINDLIKSNYKSPTQTNREYYLKDFIKQIKNIDN
jgi:hypothetical protein